MINVIEKIVYGELNYVFYYIEILLLNMMRIYFGKMSYFKDIGFKIFIFDNFKLYSLSFLCRWVCFEFCVDLLKFVGKEILISDVFEYIIFIVYINGEVELEVFFYDYFDIYEII